MIDEIFKNYEEQLNENFKLMGKHFGLESEFISTPNANHDLIVILDSINLLNDEVDSFKLIDDFYEKTVKEGILLGLGFGKAHMIKKVLEMPITKDDILKIDLEEYNELFPKFDESNSTFNRWDEDGIGRIRIIVDDELSDIEKETKQVHIIAKIIDKNHKEIKKMLFEDFIKEFEIDRKKARYGLKKKVKLDSKNLNPQIRSRFFKDRTGNYRIKHIIEDYFELMIDTGMEIGIKMGFKIVIEDIQNEKINYDLLKYLNETEIMMYIQKEHSEYILKKYKNTENISVI